MAYIVTIDDWRMSENYFYAYKGNALEKFNSLLEELKLTNPTPDSVPCKVVCEESWMWIKVERIKWEDASNNKFIFFDNEENWILVLWDRATFWAEYVKLSKIYEKNNREWSDFYDKLERNLLKKWVQIIADIPIIREKDLDWK